MKNNSIDVSIVVMTYNHINYIKKALDSILEQQYNGTYEIVIGDDCSTDGTSDIILEYFNKYPDIIKPHIRTQNIGAKRNMYELMTCCQGKYMAFLDSDDFWNNPQKLQKQVDFLNNNPSYIGCVGQFYVTDKDGVPYHDRDFEIQMINQTTYSKQEFEKGKLASHISTLLCKNLFLMYPSGFFSFWNDIDDKMAGDITMYMLLTLHGNIYCLNDNFSCYRKDISPTSTSYSSLQATKNKRDHLFLTQIQLETIAKKFFNKKISCSKFKKNIFASAVFQWCRTKHSYDWKVIMNIIRYSRQPILFFLYLIYLLSAKKILLAVYKKDVRVPF